MFYFINFILFITLSGCGQETQGIGSAALDWYGPTKTEIQSETAPERAPQGQLQEVGNLKFLLEEGNRSDFFEMTKIVKSTAGEFDSGINYEQYRADLQESEKWLNPSLGIVWRGRLKFSHIGPLKQLKNLQIRLRLSTFSGKIYFKSYELNDLLGRQLELSVAQNDFLISEEEFQLYFPLDEINWDELLLEPRFQVKLFLSDFEMIFSKDDSIKSYKLEEEESIADNSEPNRSRLAAEVVAPAIGRLLVQNIRKAQLIELDIAAESKSVEVSAPQISSMDASVLFCQTRRDSETVCKTETGSCRIVHQQFKGIIARTVNWKQNNFLANFSFVLDGRKIPEYEMLDDWQFRVYPRNSSIRIQFEVPAEVKGTTKLEIVAKRNPQQDEKSYGMLDYEHCPLRHHGDDFKFLSFDPSVKKVAVVDGPYLQAKGFFYEL